jgi:hypothetical protein
MGSSTIVYAPIGGTLVSIETGKETRLAAGAAISIAVAPDQLHLFDRTTDQALPRERI